MQLIKGFNKIPGYIKNQFLTYLPRGLLSLLSLLFFYALARFAFNKISTFEPPDKDPNHPNASSGKILLKTLGDIVFYGILTLGMILTLVNLGLQINTIFVVLGSIGLAIALALQNTISNVSSGIIILLLNYYEIGDVVEINDTLGTIDNFDLLNTSIINTDGVIIRMPNNTIINGALTNYFKKEDMFHSFKMNLSNNENNEKVDKVLNLIKEEFKNNFEYISDKERISVYVSDMTREGTVVIIKLPIKSKNFLIVRRTAPQVARKIASDNKLYLLDHMYMSDGSNNSTSVKSM
jgi:small-conductance mechanosensitive channel